MRKLKIIEHISLDGVIQVSGGPSEDGDFPPKAPSSPIAHGLNAATKYIATPAARRAPSRVDENQSRRHASADLVVCALIGEAWNLGGRS